VTFDGTHLQGRQEIASANQKLFDTFVKGSRLVGKVRGIRLPTPDVAVLHVVGGTVMAGQLDIDKDRNSVQTLVSVKKGSEWQIALVQNSRAQYI
jgi:uncharacterized protein (TIGR02246 family)